MRISQSVYSNAAKKIEILLSALIEYIAAAPMRENHVAPLVRIHQMTRGVPQDGALRGTGAICVDAVLRFFCFRFQCATPVALAGNSEVIRVPGNRVPLAAVSNPLGTEPPTIRTSATPAERARLHASSFRIIPPETLFWRIMSSASPVETTLSTFEPSSTPATSVR